MQSQRFFREAFLKRSRFAATSMGQPQLTTNQTSKICTSLLRTDQTQQRYFSSRPSPFRQQKLAKQRPASSRTSPQAVEEAKKSANSKIMLVGANAVLFFGMSMWLLLFVDKYFQNRERECIQQAHEQLAADFADMEQWDTKYKDHQALFTCMVRVKSRELKDLFPVEIGEVVDVLVEGVGRDGTLNICRTRPQNPHQKAVISLYPMGCLQRVKLEDYQNNSA